MTVFENDLDKVNAEIQVTAASLAEVGKELAEVQLRYNVVRNELLAKRAYQSILEQFLKQPEYQMRSTDWRDYDHCDKCWAAPDEPCWDMRSKRTPQFKAKRPHPERQLKDLKTGRIKK